MNVEYTAAMEHELDEIEEGKDNLLNTLNQFWKKFEKDLKKAQGDEGHQGHGGADRRDLRQVRLARWSSSGAATGSSWPAPAIPSARTRASSPGARATDAPELHEDVAKEVCPKDGQPMVLKKGRFGPFLACSNYPDCKTTQAPRARRGGQARR